VVIGGDVGDPAKLFFSGITEVSDTFQVFIESAGLPLKHGADFDLNSAIRVYSTADILLLLFLVHERIDLGLCFTVMLM
jgi:hypothetical protein